MNNAQPNDPYFMVKWWQLDTMGNEEWPPVNSLSCHLVPTTGKMVVQDYHIAMILTYAMLNWFIKHGIIFVFPIISYHLHDTECFDLSSCKTRTCLSCIFNMMAADVLATQPGHQQLCNRPSYTGFSTCRVNMQDKIVFMKYPLRYDW